MALSMKLFAVLLLASAASAKTLYCPILGGNTHDWFVNSSPQLTVQTTFETSTNYVGSMNCFFAIRADMPGRILVQVIRSEMSAYQAQISIYTDYLSGFLATWDQLTYNVDRHRQFVSSKNRIYISFTSKSTPLGWNSIVQLQLTFLRSDGCLPAWRPLMLANAHYCIGRPVSKGFAFGEAQRYCNLWRSNLLVSDRDNVSYALGYVNAFNAWIGMNAEPSGTYSVYRWINQAQVDRSVTISISCTGGCTPGSKNHRCVQAVNQQSLAQIDCDTKLEPICYMPAGGTDLFFKSSKMLQASGTLLSGAMILIWSLVR